jgi:hypothetical protein
VFEAMMGRETEFVRTPKHGIRGKLGNWSSKRYRAARSLTPVAELLMAGYFMVAVNVAITHGHYISVPFLMLFLFGFGYVGAVSAWQGWLGQSLRGLWSRPQESAGVSLISAPLVAAMPDATPGPVLIATEMHARSVRKHEHHENEGASL